MIFETIHGGFDPDTSEYVMSIRARANGEIDGPPRPWINVIANDRFGFLVSEWGAISTWSENSREHRLTPWFNDSVADPHGEAFYIRDEGTGKAWSLCPGPVGAGADYEVRHGFGVSSFRHVRDGLDHELLLFVPRHDAVRIARVHIQNRSARARRLSLYAYSQLVLGGLPGDSGRFVVTEIDPSARVAFARNRAEEDFANRVVFAGAAPACDSSRFCCDRAEFIGRNRGVSNPVALEPGARLAGTAGAGLSPCIAQQVEVEIPPDGSIEVAFLLGEGENIEHARELIDRYRAPHAVEQALAEIRAFWREGLSGLQIHTPDPALDLMVNGWLAYQVLACRIQARSALYQSGGAFGFRDQIQDASALVYLWPERTREQILLHAAHQFVEGDVLHWWHPPLGRGIRTRFVDDLLWLPYMTSFYIETTGDVDILAQEARFITTRPLAEGEDEAFLLPEDAIDDHDLYEHCCRALDRSLVTGSHGLPLFGTGDWNDGMNRVGREGRGESVWMGFFLHDVLAKFIPFCRMRNDLDRASAYEAHRDRLRVTLNDAGWDGGWYRRGYYDSGDPLGSSHSDECQIDALAQAWAVISGAAPEERARTAMAAVERRLISDHDQLIRLLTPPFQHTAHDPGYIRGYVPGVRENGGQYTHAALWVVRAVAELSLNNRAAALLAMINPINHSRTPEQIATYQVEPYVVAADVYGEAPHVGRGGWTWYTGSAGWMYRVAVESILGLRLIDGRELAVRPCIPDDWPGFTLTYRIPGEATSYRITVANPQGRAGRPVAATFDGVPIAIGADGVRIRLAHDGLAHSLEIVLGPRDGDR